MANNQEVQMLYSELINRMKQGVEMHEQLADYYAFLNLPGYQKCHEYQMLCELLTYRKAKDMYLKEYNKLVQPNYAYANMPASMNNMANSGSNNGNSNMAMNRGKNYAMEVIPQNWYNYTRYDVDASTKRNAVKEGFKKWIDYENETKQYLNQMVKQLEQLDENTAAKKLETLIEHVEKEIATAEDKIMNLESTGYDMSYILQQQEGLKQKYAKKIREMNEKENQFRRRGSGTYANYNFTDDDEEDDDEKDFTYMRGGRGRYPRY